jgi:hypothetical protein
MAQPAVSVTTQRQYEGLPEIYRESDAQQLSGGGFPLLRFMSLIADQAGDVEALLDRIGYRAVFDGGAPGDTSDLTDPVTADAAWLPWLAQLVGIRFDEVFGVNERRAAITSAADGWRAGSTRSVVAAVQSVLAGNRLVIIDRHHEGDDHKVLIRTRTSETEILTWRSLEATYPTWGELEDPSSWGALNPRNVLRTLEVRQVKPAGVQFFHELGTLTWGRLESEAPSWADIEALGSWAALEDI